MKIRLQQLNQTIGAMNENVASIRDAMDAAERDGIDLLILPELVVCGYPPMDLLERVAFREAIYEANKEIIETSGETGVLFGSVTPNPSAFGRKCFNSAILAWRGEQRGIAHKSLLPTYDVYDDLRYFQPAETRQCIEFKGVKFGVTICEDIWYNENDIQYHTYETNPAGELAEQGAQVIVNISASPFTKNKPFSRRQMMQNHVRRLGIPLLYANQVGAHTELIFDGDSMAINKDAEVIARKPLFEESSLDVSWNDTISDIEKASEEPVAPLGATEEGMFKGLAKGLEDYLEKTGHKKEVLIGVSGGIDSALATCIAVEALGAGHVTGVSMPSEFSSEESVSDSKKLAENLGIELKIISIHDIFRQFREELKPHFGDSDFGVAEENIQPRVRATLLMALSNKNGAMLLNTGNKSELATGYCTMYGDMAGGLGIISDVYKTEVYQLSRWLNSEYYKKEIIPQNILEKEPSAELRPGQKDSDFLPGYDILDPILNLYLEEQCSLEEIAGHGFREDTIRKVIKMVNRADFKRFQAAPGLKISTKAFGSGRRWPLAQKWKE